MQPEPPKGGSPRVGKKVLVDETGNRVKVKSPNLKRALVDTGLTLSDLQKKKDAELQSERTPLPPEALRARGVPAVTVTHHRGWQCAEFAETTREYWVYVPQQYTPGTPAKLVVCQDGNRYLDEGNDPTKDGEIRVPAVLDSMIFSGELPPTVALFIRPGVPWPDSERTEKGLCPKDDVSPTDWERSFEYDSITSNYGDMLINELIPLVEQKHGVTISSDPMDRLIMGHSSGGIASMAAGFHHPEAFGCVVSHCASKQRSKLLVISSTFLTEFL